MRVSISFLLGVALLTVLSCSADTSPLRGEEEQSSDGLTYLVIEEGNGCETILVDGLEWSHDLKELGQIEAGIHTIDCNGKIEFEIKEGTVFRFDYWGP